MRASVLLIIAVLIALWAFDKFENDGRYTQAIEKQVGLAGH